MSDLPRMEGCLPRSAPAGTRRLVYLSRVFFRIYITGDVCFFGGGSLPSLVTRKLDTKPVAVGNHPSPFKFCALYDFTGVVDGDCVLCGPSLEHLHTPTQGRISGTWQQKKAA